MNFLKAKNIDATTGVLWKKIILYTIPIILGAVVQNCFNAVDLIVLGNLADSTAVAAIGATTSITYLLVNSFIGIATGAQLILSRMFGARDNSGIKKTTGTSLITAAILGLLIIAIGIPFSPAFLTWTNCPENCLNGAVIYIRIYILSAPAILLYNFGASILRAAGDSQRPLYYIIISGLVNVVLNVLLCLILPNKVVAVAVATAFSQIVGAALTLRRLSIMEGAGRITLSELHFDRKTFGSIMALGLPIALNSALYPFSNLQIQSAINSFGVSAIAGNSASASIEGIFNSVPTSFGATTAVFVGQNLGAGKPKRAKQVITQCLAIGCGIGIVLGITIYSTSDFWLSLFLPDDPAGIEYGRIRMFFVLLFMSVCCARDVYGSGLQGCGHVMFTTFTSIIGVFGFRLLWMWFIYPHFSTFPMLMACFLISWTLVLISNMTGFYTLGKKALKEQ